MVYDFEKNMGQTGLWLKVIGFCKNLDILR